MANSKTRAGPSLPVLTFRTSPRPPGGRPPEPAPAGPRAHEPDVEQALRGRVAVEVREDLRHSIEEGLPILAGRDHAVGRGSAAQEALRAPGMGRDGPARGPE